MANVPFTNNWWNPDTTGGVPSIFGGTGMGKGMGSGMGGGLGGPAGGIGNLILALKGMMGGHGPNPAKEASDIVGQIPGATKGYTEPYMNAGKTALEERMKRYGQDPGEIYKHLGEGYTQSPGYKFQMEQAMNAANNSAASGGALGTPYSQQAAQESAQGIASQDYEKYLNHVLGIYGDQNTGLTDITHGGQDASQKFADLLSQVMGTQGQYKYNETDINNTNNNQDWQQLIQGLAQLFGG